MSPRNVHCARISLASILFALLLPTQARAGDPGAARVQLQQGYALKQAGNCKDAIPYFVESIRLDRQAKTLIHLADCERASGQYVAAEQHLVAARDAAREQSAAAFVTLAESRLAELEPHLPRLTLRLGADAAADSVVTRDGVVLAALSLGVALPVDPGAHQVRVRGGGFEREYTLELRDGENKELQVTSVGGTPLPATAEPIASPPPEKTEVPKAPPPLEAARSTPAPGTAHGPPWRTLGFVAAGAGTAGLIVGTVFGLRARSKSEDADALCTASNPCDNEGVSLYHQRVSDAKSARTAAIVSFAAGGALLATGGVLLLASSKTGAQGLRFAPSIGANALGATAEGTW